MIVTEIGDSLESTIAASWERCERQHSLVRETAYPILRLQTSEVTPRFEAMVERVGGRHGIFRQLAEVAAASGQCLIVSDADGITVRLESKNQGQSEFERYGIALGSCWDERVAGTNGVAMAMAQNKVFTVRGKDHFFSNLNPFACTAVPIFDAENQMIGSVTLATIDRGNAAEYMFSQQLLSAGAGKVQRILFEQRFRDAMMISVSASGKGALLPNDELVAVDETGIILGATARTPELVQLAEPSELLGKSFEAVFGADIDALDRVPERVLSTRIDTGGMLNLSMQQPDPIEYPGRGWRQPAAKPKPKRVRRRLSTTLRELAIGSEAMASALERAQAQFERAFPFIVEGESGTGKSALISALHGAAKLPHTQMATIDCALLDDLAENRSHIETILGRARVIDAFDDTDRDSATLVFDNVDELPDYGQVRLRSLLTALEEANESGLDGPGPASAVRIVATSRKPLKDAVEQGRFRDDLFFLLGNARIELPPLRVRERPEALARALASSLAGADVEVTEEAANAIGHHTWPGNVRELRSTLRQALMSGDGQRISLLDLRATSALSDAGRNLSPADGNHSPDLSRPYDEKAMILDALLGANWNVTRAARNLGMGRATIHRKMKHHGIVRPTGVDQTKID